VTCIRCATIFSTGPKRIEAEIEYGDSHLRVRIQDGEGIPKQAIERAVLGRWCMAYARASAVTA
jgi:signal transduction histidine kinase